MVGSGGNNHLLKMIKEKRNLMQAEIAPTVLIS